MKVLSLLYHYLKDRAFILLILICCIGIFTGIFSLYNLELEAIYYASFLTFFFLFILFCFDLYGYLKKHITLTKLKEQICMSDEYWVKDNTLLGQDYQALIKELKEYNKEIITNHEHQVKDMEDYFTLWVHQVKLPIAAMKLLLETEEKPDKRLLKSELFRINQYTDMVLAYLRMQSHETDYVIKNYMLDDIIQQAIRKFSGEFIRKKLKLNFIETYQLVLTDEKWLVFVLEQVLSNALKYTQTGEIKIYAKKENVLVVEDTGMGIEESDLPRVFDKGYTGINGRKDKKASGIGLYLCKNIMKNLSHDIQIESKVQVGTKVILYLDHYDLKVE